MSFPFAGPSHQPANHGTFPRFKRQRSSSPPTPSSPNAQIGSGRGGFEALASPLEEALIKRRRRDDAFGYFGGIGRGGGQSQVSENGGAAGQETGRYAGASVQGSNGRGAEGGAEVQPGVERRRNKLWAARNAPTFGSQESHEDRSVNDTGPSPYGHGTAHAVNGVNDLDIDAAVDLEMDHSIPDVSTAPFTAPRASQQSHTHLHLSHHLDSSLAGPSQRGHMMSSSPVRHEPPGSSPFKSASQTEDIDPDATLRMSQRPRPALGMGSGRGVGVNEAFEPQTVDNGGVEESVMEVEMEMEELEKEWGEYRGANSLLYQLHRARTTPQHDRSRFPHAYTTPNNGFTTPLNDRHTPFGADKHDYFGISETPVRPASQAGTAGHRHMLDSASAFVTPFPSRTSLQQGRDAAVTHRGSATANHLGPGSSRPYTDESPIPHSLRSFGANHLPSSPMMPHLANNHHACPFSGPAQQDMPAPAIQAHHQRDERDQYNTFRTTQHIPSSPFLPPSASSTQYPSSSATRYEHDTHDIYGRNALDDSSPLPHHPDMRSAQVTALTPTTARHAAHTRMYATGQQHTNVNMNMDMDEAQMQREEQEAMRRYEEMNRQLGEFAVARRERWGGE